MTSKDSDGNGFSKRWTGQSLESLAQRFQYCQVEAASLSLEMPPEPRAGSSVQGGRLGWDQSMEGREQGPDQLTWTGTVPRLPWWDKVSFTCGSEQQGAVLAVQVFHGRDPRVPRVPVVEIVQLFPFLPVPKTVGGRNST